MKVRAQVASVFSAIAAITLSTACSSGSPSVTQLAGNGRPPITLLADNVSPLGHLVVPQQNGAVRGLFPFHFPSALQLNMAQRSSMSPNLPNSLVYVAYANNVEVIVYDPVGKVLGNIAPLASPAGLFVDRNHDLWVTQSGWFIDPGIVPQMPTVLEFGRGSTRPKRTLLAPGTFPNDVTVCPNGTAYVASFASQASGYKAGGNIAVYAPGSTKPTGRLNFQGSYSGPVNDLSVTCDAAGNVFSTYLIAHSHGIVVEFPHGRQAGATQLPISSPPYTFFVSVKPDAAGNLLLVQSNSPSGNPLVCEYSEAGVPTGQCMTLPGNTSAGIAVNNDNVLLDADETDNRGISMRFPSGMGSVIYPGPYYSSGVALDPGL